MLLFFTPYNMFLSPFYIASIKENVISFFFMKKKYHEDFKCFFYLLSYNLETLNRYNRKNLDQLVSKYNGNLGTTKTFVVFIFSTMFKRKPLLLTYRM